MNFNESMELTAILQRIESKGTPLMSDQKAQQLKQQIEPSLEDTNEFAKVISKINLDL
jgi:ABC-type hemin transport system substrate-binding protein